MTEQLFPSIKTLYTQSIENFKSNLGKLILLDIVTIFSMIIVMVTTMAVMFAIGFNQDFFKSLFMDANFSVLENIPYAYLGVIALIFILISTILMSAYSIATMIIIGKYKEKIKFLESVRSSFKLIIPFIAIQAVVTFFVLGGMIIFIIPGVIISFLLMFAIYETILENKSVMKSIRNSYLIVSSNFGDIFIRILSFLLIYVIFTMIFEFISQNYSSNNAIVNLLFGLLKMALSWFGTIFSILLYKQARNVTDLNKKVKFTWMWIISGLGWIIILLSTLAAVKLIQSNTFRENIKKEFMSEVSKQQSSLKKQSSLETSNYYHDIDPKAQEYLDQSSAYFDELRSAQLDNKPTKKLIDIANSNIILLKKAVKEFPEEAKLWSQLGDAYTWQNSVGTLQDGLNAKLKAEELEPNNSIYVTGVGILYSRLSYYNEAILKLNKALRLNDKDALAHMEIAYAYKKIKIYNKAQEHYQRALELYSNMNADGTFDRVILEIQKQQANIPR